MSAAKRPKTNLARNFGLRQLLRWPASSSAYREIEKLPDGWSTNQAQALQEKYGDDGTVPALKGRSPIGEQIDASLEGGRILTPIADFHEQIRSMTELAMTTPATLVESEVWRFGTRWGNYDLDCSPDPSFDDDLYESALNNQETGPTGVQRIRTYWPAPWASPHAYEYSVAMPWQTESMCKSILENAGVPHCVWCFWSNWSFNSVTRRLMPPTADHGMMVSAGSTTVLLGTCAECRRRFAGDLAATGETGQIDYATGDPDEFGSLDDDDLDDDGDCTACRAEDER